ncbi:MAG: HesA/MoeB/ThiF family protein [Cyclobacteriaceae bacterium]
MLRKEEISRYKRHLVLDQVGGDGQQKLKSAKVLIVGMGGLGCPVAQYLVAAGVGSLTLIDPDLVDESNLHRQILFSSADVGQPKVEVALKKLNELNPFVKITTHQTLFSLENAQTLVSQVDMVVDGTDNFQSKYLINDACVLENKPMISASIFKFEGQLSVFNYQNGPTYRCAFPQESSGLDNCEEVGVLGVLPGVLGTMQAVEVLKIILGIGDVLAGKLKLINTLSAHDQIIEFDRDEGAVIAIKKRGLRTIENKCELDHDAFYLDVRNLYELPVLNASSMLQIPLKELEKRYTEIPRNRDVKVVCQSGMRSKQAIKILESKFGFNNLTNLEGGILSLEI